MNSVDAPSTLHPHPIINRLLELDYRLFIRWYRLPIRWNRFLRGLLVFGDVPIWILLFSSAYILGTIFQDASLQRVGLMLFWAIWISALTLILPKVVVVRKRPYVDEKFRNIFNFVVENRDPIYGKKHLESFPSGHCFFTWMAWVVFTYIFGWPGFVLAGLLAFPMPIFRGNLGVHFPSDVYAGALLGGLTGAIVIWLDAVFIEWMRLWLDSVLKTSFGWIVWVILGILCVFIVYTGKKRK